MRPFVAAAVGAVWCASNLAAAQPPAPGEPIEPTTPIEAPEVEAPETGQPEWPRRVLPGVLVHAEERWVEIDGFVPIATSPEFEGAPEPDVLLEVVVTARGGGRDHEALVLTDAKPSHVHASLMLLGLEPGEPGKWREIEGEGGAMEIEPVPPRGDRVGVEIRWEDEATGEERSVTPGDWIRHIETGETPGEEEWVFAGSQFVLRESEERYDADFTGTLVGLAQFGSEVVAWSKPYHHEQAVQRPIWFARNEAVPAFGTEVTVRLSAVDDGSEDEESNAEPSPSEGEGDAGERGGSKGSGSG
jgi:hypothetical protein